MLTVSEKGGFVLPDEVEENSDPFENKEECVSLEDLDLPEEVTFDEYVNGDSDLQYSPMLSYEDMVRLNSTAVEGKDDTDDVGDSLHRVTHSRVRAAYQDIRAYLLSNSDGDCYKILQQLDMVITKGASALGTECALNGHSIRIDRVRTRNVKVPNRIECTLSQSTFVCGLNPVRSGLEWNVGGRSLRYMTEVCTCILVRGRLAERR